MGISALKTLLVYGQRPPISNQTENPDAGPSMFFSGTGLIDPRVGYNNTTLGAIGWYGNGRMPVVDAVPSAISAVNIAAAQVPTAGTPLTLVSSTGAGITVLATPLLVYASGNTIPAGSLAIDGPPGLVGIGTPVPATGNARMRYYDPTKAISRCLRYTSVGDDHLATVTTVGADFYGYQMTETVTLTNAGVATGKKAFEFIYSVTPGGTLSGSNISVGTSDVYGFPIAMSSQRYSDIYWGSGAQITNLTSSPSQVVILPLQLADIANSAAYQIAIPFDFTITGAKFRTAKPATTAAKAATLTLALAGVSIATGGVISLTSANQNTAGGLVNSSAFSGVTGAGGTTVGVNASAVTAFVEGDGWVELTVLNSATGGAVFTAADTTSPATASTGDARGTIQVPTASDGTRRLQIFTTISLAEVSNSNPAVGIFGVTPA